MKRKVFLVDVDGTIANTPKRLNQLFPDKYVSEKQLDYYIPDELLESFNKDYFYLKDMETIKSTVNYLNMNLTKDSTIIFLSKSLSEDIAVIKKDFIKDKLLDQIKAINYINYSLDYICDGEPDIKEILKNNNLPETEFYCLDDNPSRIKDYINLKDNLYNNLTVVPVVHPYNKSYLKQVGDKFSSLIYWN